MKLVLFSILCCVCCSYGEEKKQNINFQIDIMDGDAYCKAIPKEVTITEGQSVRLYASIEQQEGIWRATCTYNNGSGDHELGDEFYKDQAKSSWFLDVDNVKKHQFGDWRCYLGFNKFNKYGLKAVRGQYTYVDCIARVKREETNGPPHSGRSLLNTDMKTIAIIGGVGICVVVIIIAQTIALCYFKRKAQPRRRMDKLTSRTAFDRGDRARYSAPPCRKNSKGNARAQADTDSHIYEMVGVNALYKESNELQQEIKNDTSTAERSVKQRPPLPLPHEVPEPAPIDIPRPKPLKSTPSTLSLNSTCSSASTMTWKKKGKDLPPPPGQASKKAPARPPKQFDEESMPGSLRRPPKTSPGLIPPKAGSIPRMPANDPSVIELKNALKKRNIGNDSPAPSPTSTLERKPPIVQSKPKKLQPETKNPPPTPKPQVNPVQSGSNQIRLIIPKIEASLRPPPKLVPAPVKTSPLPMKKLSHNNQMSPPSTMSHPYQSTHANPMSHSNQTPFPTSHANPTSRLIPMSHPNQMSHPSPMSQARRPLPPVSHLTTPAPAPVPHMSPLQSRPLPTPGDAGPSRPLPRPNEAAGPPRPLPSDPMPPIYQIPDEDNHEDTDDEEWTYSCVQNNSSMHKPW